MNSNPKFQISFTQGDLRKLLWFLIGLDLFLALMYLMTFVIAPNFRWGPIDDLFDLDNDLSIPSWFASLQYLFIAILAITCAIQSSGKKIISKKFLYFMGVISLYLALDEGVGIHEQISFVARNLNIQWVKSLTFEGGHGVWISLYAILGIVLILFVYRDLLSIWASFKNEGLYILIGGVLLVMGEVGFEIISYLFLSTDAAGVLYNVEVTLEEFFAMVGVSLILFGVLMFLAKLQSGPQPRCEK